MSDASTLCSLRLQITADMKQQLADLVRDTITHMHARTHTTQFYVCADAVLGLGEPC
jgi:hypothetical protein